MITIDYPLLNPTFFVSVFCHSLLNLLTFFAQAVDRILAHLRSRFATYFGLFEQYAQKNVFHVPELDFSVRRRNQS